MENKSGIKPTWNRVLVLPDKAKEKTESGLIAIPKSVQEKELMAQVKYTLIANGGSAYDLGSPEPWGGVIPQPGDRVYVAKYAGIILKGEDGEIYRMVNDQDVIAIIKEA